MIGFQANKWKFTTIALAAIIAVGFSFPQTVAAASATLNDVFKKLTSVETSVNEIKAKTNNLPANPASVATVTDARDAINAHTDSEIASIPAGLTPEQYQTLKCQSELKPHGDYSNCNWQSIHASGASVRGANLENAKLNGGLLSDVNFQEVDGQYADLFRADLRNTDFQDAKLLLADFNNSNLQNAFFVDADLTDANFGFANLDGANFNGADLSGANFIGCHGTPIGSPALGTLPTCS